VQRPVKAGSQQPISNKKSALQGLELGGGVMPAGKFGVRIAGRQANREHFFLAQRPTLAQLKQVNTV